MDLQKIYPDNYPDHLKYDDDQERYEKLGEKRFRYLLGRREDGDRAKDAWEVGDDDEKQAEEVDENAGRKKNKKPSKVENKAVRTLSIEDDLHLGMLGSQESQYDPDPDDVCLSSKFDIKKKENDDGFEIVCEESDDDESMDSLEAMHNFCGHMVDSESEDECSDDSRCADRNSEPKGRNLSKLKPWEKTLPEFVVGHMAHSPCGPNVKFGCKRRCWVNGKCKGNCNLE